MSGGGGGGGTGVAGGFGGSAEVSVAELLPEVCSTVTCDSDRARLVTTSNTAIEPRIPFLMANSWSSALQSWFLRGQAGQHVPQVLICTV
jgi:hypothetical protein